MKLRRWIKLKAEAAVLESIGREAFAKSTLSSQLTSVSWCIGPETIVASTVSRQATLVDRLQFF